MHGKQTKQVEEVVTANRRRIIDIIEGRIALEDATLNEVLVIKYMCDDVVAERIYH